MKKVYFRKIFAYDPTLEGKYDKFDGYAQSTLQLSSPCLLPGQKASLVDVEIKSIVHSSLLRGVQSSDLYKVLYPQAQKMPVDSVREVIFDLSKLLTKEEFLREGSNLVRKRFIEAFIADSLGESREVLKERILHMIETLENLNSPIIVISHSFFMKLVDIYFKEPMLFESPEKIRYHFDPLVKTFEFGSGFEIEL